MNGVIALLIGVAIACGIVFWDTYMKKQKKSGYAISYQISSTETAVKVNPLANTIANIIKADTSAKVPIKNVQHQMKVIDNYAVMHPEIGQRLTRYYSYYVPTFENLIYNYYSIIQYKVHNSESQIGKKHFYEALKTMSVTFDHLIAEIMAPTTLDLSCDADVLKTIAAMDGYVNKFPISKL